jgi:stage II sporulation protein D
MNIAHYHGNVEFSVDYERIRIINQVDEDVYLAGVVEAESGTVAHLMYYMAHAIICRTYLYGNFRRHADESFDLCDEVHCQVYKGRLTGNETIYEAVNLTEGKVIVYGENGLITAAFHSNCGGETVNSEEVWLAYRPYLRSVKDPFCLERPGARWVRTIDAGEWETYLVGMGLDRGGRSFSSSDFISRQQGRNSLYQIDRFAIPYRKIRSDWDFRSAWFSMEATGQGKELFVAGRGYGHGVGLCQEGAMEMARRGYNFMQILEFYYTNIKVISTEEVND